MRSVLLRTKTPLLAYAAGVPSIKGPSEAGSNGTSYQSATPGTANLISSPSPSRAYMAQWRPSPRSGYGPNDRKLLMNNVDPGVVVALVTHSNSSTGICPLPPNCNQSIS